MKLLSATIRNFRSVSRARISFASRSVILVGINESGKSNILKALSLLKPDRKSGPQDVREPLPSENPIEDGYIDFEIALDDAESTAAFDKCRLKFLGNRAEPVIKTKQGTSLTLEQFVRLRSRVNYRVVVSTGKRYWQYFKLDDDGYTATSPWRKIKKGTASDVVATPSGGKPVPINQYHAANLSSVSGIAAEHLEDLGADDFAQWVLDAQRETISEKLPACVFWEYDEKYLLPSRISAASFTSNPDICLPLKYMFELAGFSEIDEAFEAHQSRPAGLRNLLNRVAELATKQLRDTWKEVKNVTIELLPNGGDIEAHIRDSKNLYGFQQRSDGFKRFITFLLMISARVRSKDLRDALLLYDEPEISLHPSGARYLRDELRKISETNLVVYSTHSPFMIDSDHIDRHVIVRKKDETTSLDVADASNYRDEEVLFNAIGLSIFDIIGQTNIVFEGRRDKRLFDVALSRIAREKPSLKNAFSKIGTCFVRGVKEVASFTPMLQLANRDCLILSDSDPVAMQLQSQYEGHGTWYRYDELLPNESAITGEDFVQTKAIIDAVGRTNVALDTKVIVAEEAMTDSRGKLAAVAESVRQAGITDKHIAKAWMNRFKDEVFDVLKPSHLERKYFDLLEQVELRLSELHSAS